MTRKGKRQNRTKNKNTAASPAIQHIDAFLVVDVEGTCVENGPFEYPNEIIEWPVFLLRWDHTPDGHPPRLTIVDTFRSLVKPTWRPQLSDFCIHLTGITQKDIDTAPTFLEVMKYFEDFLARNGLYDVHSNKRLVNYIFCCDGPWDLRDFFVKQMHISRLEQPGWLPAEFLNVRQATAKWYFPHPVSHPKLSLTSQLAALKLKPFVGRQHCGINDAYNVVRIMQSLATRGVQLSPNSCIDFHRRWAWMGKNGRVHAGKIPCKMSGDQYCVAAD